MRTGVARSRAVAQQLVADGQVHVDGTVARRAGQVLRPGAEVVVSGEQTRWVGRGAMKLDHALRLWAAEGLAVRGRRCLDVGASTGGFTQVLLEAGAEHVVALDVGHGQLAPSVAADPRVLDLPGTHIRDADLVALGGPRQVVVADLSFIPTSSLMAVLAHWLADDGDLVVLVKPQFEVGPDRVGRGGVVRDPRARSLALRGVLSAAYDAGLGLCALTTSPIAGGAGNVEYLVWVRHLRPGMMGAEAAVDLGARLTEEERR